MFYLLYTYETPRETAPTYDHIGPFGTEGDAKQHQWEWGPVQAEVVSLSELPPSPKMTPAEHIAYMEPRT